MEEIVEYNETEVEGNVLMKKLSTSATEMLRSGKGYRNNDRGTGYYFIQEIVKYETEELENEDILDTCTLLYGTTNVMGLIHEKFGTTKLHGLWLTTLDGVLENYGEEDITLVTPYKIPSDALIISDLDAEGALFVYPVGKHPKESILVTIEIDTKLLS